MTEPLGEKGAAAMAAPSVYRYTDLIECMQGIKTYLSATQQNEVSFTYLAEKLELQSRTQARKIFRGEVPMPRKLLEGLSQVFGLGPDESEYVELLRRFQQAKDPEAAVGIFRKINECRSRHLGDSAVHSLSDKQLRLLDEWYTMPVLYYLDLKGHSDDPSEIAFHFGGKLTSEQVEDALRTLQEIGLVRETAGKFEKVHSHVSLMDGLPRPLVKKFHQMMIQQALDSVTGLPIDRRHLMSLSLPVREELVPILQKRIADFMACLNEEFSAQDGNSLYQLNLQLFNLAAISKD